jgi:hypothetical protein
MKSWVIRWHYRVKQLLLLERSDRKAGSVSKEQYSYDFILNKT